MGRPVLRRSAHPSARLGLVVFIVCVCSMLFVQICTPKATCAIQSCLQSGESPARARASEIIPKCRLLFAISRWLVLGSVGATVSFLCLVAAAVSETCSSSGSTSAGISRASVTVVCILRDSSTLIL